MTEEKRNWGDEEGEEEANQHRDISEKNKPLWESQGQDLGMDPAALLTQMKTSGGRGQRLMHRDGGGPD